MGTAPDATKRCLHCRRLLGKWTKRGLCWRCYQKTKVRRLYPKLIHASGARPDSVPCANCKRMMAPKSLKRSLCVLCYRHEDTRMDTPAKRKGCWTASARAWEAEEVSVLLDLCKEDRSDRQIGQVLGRSEQSVQARRQDEGIRRKGGGKRRPDVTE